MLVQALDINSTTFSPAKIGSFAVILNVLIPILFTAAALVFLVMLLLAGLGWITAGDNPENLKKSKKTITSALLGLILVITSYLLVKLIGVILKVETALPL